MDTPDLPAPDAFRYRTLGIILSSLFLVVFDFSVSNVAAPSIQSGLHASFAEVQWFMAAYGTAYAVFMITSGRLGDIFGRKRLFVIGMLGFTSSSALCGLTHAPSSFIMVRVLQGTAAAIMQPQLLAMIHLTFPGRERVRAFAIFGGTIGLASISGQMAGGWLIDANLFGLQWRSVFLINLPIGIGAALAAALLVPESRSPRPLQVDLAGVAMAIPALLALMIPLVQGSESGWPAWMLVSAALSVPLLFAFVRLQRWKMRSGKAPLVDLRLFSEGTFAVGLVVTVVYYLGLSAFFLVLSIFLQNGLHFTPTQTATSFTPYAVAFFVASLLSARLFRRIGALTVHAGAATMILGLLMLLHLVDARGESLTAAAMLPAMILYGFGNGCITAQLNGIVLTSAKSDNAGSAAGILTTLQQLACAGGVGIVGNVFNNALGSSPTQSAYMHALHSTLSCNIFFLLLTIAATTWLKYLTSAPIAPPAIAIE